MTLADPTLMSLAVEVVERHFAERPELASLYGAEGRRRCHEDALHHLTHLDAAVTFQSPALFGDYVAWVAVLFGRLNIPRRHLADDLRIVEAVAAEAWDADRVRTMRSIIRHAEGALAAAPSPPTSHLTPGGPLADVAQRYLDALLRGRRHQALEEVEAAARSGADLGSLYLEVFQPVQREIGRLWQLRQIDEGREHYATAATQLALSILYARQPPRGPRSAVAVAACIGDELHELGLRMVADFLELDGWDSHYLGPNLPAPALLAALAEREARMFVASASFAPNLGTLAEVIELVRAEFPAVHVLVGGRVFEIDPELPRRIGADDWARDAAQARLTARKLVERGR